MSSVNVRLKTSNGTYLLEQGSFKLDANGRLPLREICDKFGIKDPIWQEMEEKLEICKDGYSEMKFAFAAGKSLDIGGTSLKTNQPVERHEIAVPMKKQEPAPKLEHSTDLKTQAERAEEDRLLKNLNKETRGPNVAADKAAHDAQLEKEKEAAREKGEWRQKQRQEEEQRSKAKQTAAATAAPAAAATPTAAPARPENNLKSAESNEIYQGAASLWNGKGHAGDVSKLAASALDHAEQLEIGKFIKEVVALYNAVAARANASSVNAARDSVPFAQAVAHYGHLASSNPDDEDSVSKYTSAIDSFKSSLATIQK